MSNELRVMVNVHLGTGARGRRTLLTDERSNVPSGRTPRISKLMALAIRFERLLAEGTVVDQAELARLGHVSRARVTQIMNLLSLAPDIQEDLLFLPPVERGKDPVTEREVREFVAVPDWRKQRRLWSGLSKRA